MKFEESVANINEDGKQSIEIRFKKDVSDFFSMLQNLDAIIDTSDLNNETRWILDCAMVIDGQCCEGDYIITTDEDDDHDFEAFKHTVRGHEWAPEVDIDDETLKRVWEKLSLSQRNAP